MDTKFLLFVDDLKDQQMSCRDAVNDWNEANEHAGRRIELRGAQTLDEGIALLKRIRFDAAFVDLKMPDGKKKADSRVGNELTHEILFKIGIPVGIISGNLADLDAKWRQSETVKTFFKGEKDVFGKAVAWLDSLWPMMDVLASSRSQIREVAAEVFAVRLWPYWSSHLAVADIPAASLVPMVARQYVWHLSEIIGEPEEGQAAWHPLENWICPHKSQRQISTGDLFDLNDGLWIVLTPPCDLANANTEDALLAYCDRTPIKEWETSLKKLKDAESDEAREKATRYFGTFLNQKAVSQHFLAPLPDEATKPILVKFNRLKTRSIKELQKNLGSRRATVSAPFVTNLTQRFGAYVSRMGQPNIDPSHFALGDPAGDGAKAVA